ncbi:MAG: hypothetical protein AAFP84_03995 [Actinomycetota bacterium]
MASNTSLRRRSPLVAPVVIALAGVLTGGGLVYALTQDDGGTLATSADTTVARPTPTSDSTVPDATVADSSGADSPSTTIDSVPLRADAARIDGVTFIETASCVAFPISNPEFGIGDAHINVNLHRMESTAGDRIIVERWTEDGSVSVGLVVPGVRSGRVDVESFPDPSSIEPVTATIPMSDGSTVALEHTLVTTGSTCPTTIVQGADEFSFAAYGLIDLCAASEESGLGSIASFQGDAALQFVDDQPLELTRESFTGRLLATTSAGEPVDAAVTGTFGAVTGTATGTATGSEPDLVGTITPGFVGDEPQPTDSLTVRLDSVEASRCSAAQEARFLD